MKKLVLTGVAMAIGILSVGTFTASAAEIKCTMAKIDSQSTQQFTKETAQLSKSLKAKDLELRQQYNYDGFDNRKVDELEAEIKHLKDEIKGVADKYGIAPCCIS